MYGLLRMVSRIFAASLSDWKYGLKVVQFDGVGLIGGKPIFPTALKTGKALSDKPLDAFWGGSATVNMPYETVLKDDNAGAVWSAKSIVFADGSAYAKSVSSESVSYTRMRIFSARVFDAELGLKCVEFRGVGLVGGKPAYPTALAGGMMLSENPRDAFFGGTATVRLPWSADYTDNDAGVVWTARSYVKADGSAVSASEANVLREYFDIITFNFPSIIDLNVNGVDGVCEIAGAARKYKAKITEKLVSASALVVPYHIARWAFYSVGGYADAVDVVSTATDGMRKCAEELDIYMRNDLKLLLDGGLINERIYATCLANKGYSPLQRYMEAVGDADSGGSGGGFANVAPALRAFKGSDREVISSLDSIAKNSRNFREMALKNRVAARVVGGINRGVGLGNWASPAPDRTQAVKLRTREYAEAILAYKEKAGDEAPSSGHVRERKIEALERELKNDPVLACTIFRDEAKSDKANQIITVWSKGEKVAWQIHDRGLYEALAGMDNTASWFWETWLGQLLGGSARVLRAGGRVALAVFDLCGAKNISHIKAFPFGLRFAAFARARVGVGVACVGVRVVRLNRAAPHGETAFAFGDVITALFPAFKSVPFRRAGLVAVNVGKQFIDRLARLLCKRFELRRRRAQKCARGALCVCGDFCAHKFCLSCFFWLDF